MAKQDNYDNVRARGFKALPMFSFLSLCKAMNKKRRQNVYILPRCFGFNRGDLISQYGFVRTLVRHQPDARIIIVTDGPGFEVEGDVIFIKNGILKDLVPRFAQLRYCRSGNTVLWAVGHDLVDESSVFIIPHMYLKFLTYRLMGMRVHIVAQGAGPIETRFARFLVRRIMGIVTTASFRDRESLNLVSSITNNCYIDKFSLVADAALLAVDNIPPHLNGRRPVLGINLRRWYHFNSIIPYEYRIRLGLLKNIPGDDTIRRLTNSFASFLDRLIEKYSLDVRFIPMYPPGGNIWEDDFKIACDIVDKMAQQDRTSILEEELEPLDLLNEFSRLDAMIGVRLLHQARCSVGLLSCRVPLGCDAGEGGGITQRSRKFIVAKRVGLKPIGVSLDQVGQLQTIFRAHLFPLHPECGQ